MNLTKIKTSVLSMDKKGELQNAYTPLQNLINKNNLLGDFTTSELKFSLYVPVDMIINDEYDGSENIILNDDKTEPKLINTRFSVQENKTFNIPIHSGNAVTNIYEEKTFDKDASLLKLYNTIPTLKFDGIFDGGNFKCGSYVFYFKMADSDGNMTNIVLESGIVQLHIGTPNTKKIRMGMENEDSKKCIRFQLTNLDRGFDYIKVFYERSSTDESQALVKSYYLINSNFPIRNGICDILLTGTEDTTEISKSDIQNEFADILTVKTQTVVDNVLFLGNVSSYEQDYQRLQLLAWKIIPSCTFEDTPDGISTKDYTFIDGDGYYNMKNVYSSTGYWADEFYRFGIVFIYNNNILSPVFNIQGCDLNKVNQDDDEYYRNFFKSNGEMWELEPDDFFFKKDKRTNSKGVIRLPEVNLINVQSGILKSKYIKMKFDFQHIWKKSIGAQEGDEFEADIKNIENYKDYFKALNIKGFFFVRQKRIPTIIAQGIVVGLTGRYNGCIPVLKNNSNYVTKSFLNKNRLLLELGSDVSIKNENVTDQALFIPDYEIDTPTLNLIFTGTEFTLNRLGSYTFINDNDNYFVKLFKQDKKLFENVKLTAVLKETKIITDGENYFSTRAGSPDEPYKTEDVNNRWDKTPPQDLTVSTSLIRGNWGSYVGMSSKDLKYGDLVNIRQQEFADPDHDILEFEKRFKDYSFYSAISSRLNIYDLRLGYITCARGDCFITPFTHRVMSNFADPELPTNTKIVSPGCWAENYAVRCTAEILTSAHSNLTGDSGGWYIPSPVNKKSAILSLIFGIFTGNLGIAIESAEELAGTSELRVGQSSYANEIVLAFEVYTGGSGADGSKTWGDNGNYNGGDSMDLKWMSENNKLKKVNPQEQESNATGLNLKAIFKCDDKWELHGLASINRSDVNAVSFGQWITFPICSRYNLALRDIDFSHATEEASFLKKRSFYPFEEMDPKNHLLESEIINGAAKVSLSDSSHPAYTTIPYIKQEYFNRIYWSKPNIAEQFINSYRIIFKDQYREYNKEFGSITKILPMGNQLLVVFLHGIGLLPVNRNPLNELEQSPYLSSKSVLPAQVSTLTRDYGSMWKDSVIQTPSGIVYGVDTVAKKIWRTTGDKLEFISDHKVSKFLNDWIDLSEYDFNEYQGHINVKTHYNEFKHDVMFTYYKDTPLDADGNPVDLSGNLVLSDTEDPKSKIASWQKGKTWNLCYNEVTNQFVTFYDWYPVESCNIDNIFFSFDKDKIDDVYKDTYSRPDALKNTLSKESLPKYKMNKVFADKMFTENTDVYILSPGQSVSLKHKSTGLDKTNYLSLYYKGLNPISNPIEEITFGRDIDWKFTYKISNGSLETLLNLSSGNIYILDCHFTKIKNGEKLTVNDPVLRLQELRNLEGPSMYLWKHGQAGLYDNQGKIKPTHWYGKQHEFNIEFVVNQDALILKIFNNLKIISNKTAPNKFEYEIVGEGYDWYDLKPVILWINKKSTDKTSFEFYYTEVLTKSYDTLKSTYIDFPELFGYEGKTIKKIPFLHLETCDKYGRQDKSYHSDTDYWDGLDPKDKGNDYKFNTSEVILVEDDLLNEQRVHTESLGNDVKKYGRLRGNMQYLEDLWDIEIRPIKFKWAYLNNGNLDFASSKESRHRDKYLKVKVRYSGEDLAVIQGIITMFDYSMA